MADSPASAPASTPSPAPSAPAPAATPAPASSPSSAPSATPGAAPKPLSGNDVREGMLAAARAAIARPKGSVPSVPSGSAPAEAAPGDPDQPKPPVEEPAAGDEPKPEPAPGEGEEEPPPFNEHPRWKKLNRDFRDAKRQLEASRPKVEEFDKIQGFMREYELTPENVAEAYDILAKIRHAPELALEALKPIVEQLALIVGEKLPDDLQKRVDDGYMDEASAKELAQTRARASQAERTGVRQQERSADRERVSTNLAIHDAVATWDSQQTSRDPDFARKRPFVEDAARSIMAREGMARTPDEARDVLKRALAHVEKNLGGFRPASRSTHPQPNGSGQPSTAHAVKEPGSIMEAAQQGLKGTYRFGA